MDLESETLQNQFKIVKKETNTSHVQEFGDIRIEELPVADFLGFSQVRISNPPVEVCMSNP